MFINLIFIKVGNFNLKNNGLNQYNNRYIGLEVPIPPMIAAG